MADFVADFHVCTGKLLIRALKAVSADCTDQNKLRKCRTPEKKITIIGQYNVD